jgi:1-acyl-sn-glycerol-3-phosphate acyltransferase
MKLKEYVKMLSSTTSETLDKINEYEREGKFNEHLDPIDLSNCLPVDGDYEYLPTGGKKVTAFFERQFVVKPFMRYTNKLFQTKVVGRENLKGLHGAIICCNHINKLDCMAVGYAISRKNTYYTAAPFNNMSGFLGDMMRVGGMLPFSDNFAAQKNMDKTITDLLKKGKYITFYPERAEWWGYEKPRPLLGGAFHYAVKNKVPIVPVFITFLNTEASLSSPTNLKKFVVNILPPLYADTTLHPKQAAQKLQEECAAAWQQTYQTFYFGR